MVGGGRGRVPRFGGGSGGTVGGGRGVYQGLGEGREGWLT